ncbi:MAG TPA: M48 family metallopeptidase [Verrucomicrobiae bacterium]|nr:M48 family metallopeptidase [Verrucomicrobiae bacterium]
MNPTSHAFEASLFHPDFGSEPVGGKVSVGPTQLRFQSETVSIDIPVANLEVEFENAGKGIWFYDTTRPDVRIFTLHQSILRHTTIRSHPQVASVLGRRDLNRALRLTLYFVGGCVLAVWLGSLAMSAMASAIAARIPPEWEQKIGAHEIDRLRQNGKLLDDSNDVTQLAALAEPLIQVLPPGRRDWKFYIADDFKANAFALPGGYVVVNAGLLRMTDQPEEILGVLAHELAHQTKRHLLRRTIAAAGPFVIFGLFLHSESRLGNFVTLGSGLMVFQGFSQQYETEADDTGWSYLVAANIDPRGMIRALQKLEALEEKRPLHGSGPQSLQSHPATAKRIARLENKWNKLARKTDFLTLAPVQWKLKNDVNN